MLWGVIVGLGTGSMAMALVATVVGRWFVARRGLVSGILTAASATGQLIFLPTIAHIVQGSGWRAASLTISVCALAVVPVVLLFLRERPADVGELPYGGTPADVVAPMRTGAARLAVGTLFRAARTRTFWLLAGGFFVCGATTTGLVQQHFMPAAHDHGMPVTHGGHAARARRRLRPRGHDRVGLADRPVRPAAPARGLLRAARGVAGAARAAVRGRPERQRPRVRHLLRARLGGHRAAHAGAHPRGVRRGGADRVRLDLRVPPARRVVRRRWSPGSRATRWAATTPPGTAARCCAWWGRPCPCGPRALGCRAGAEFGDVLPRERLPCERRVTERRIAPDGDQPG